MAFKTPEIGRAFSPDPDSRALVNFGLLSPLPDNSPWSVIALIHPSATSGHGGILARRSGFDVGSHQFSVLLAEGNLVVGSNNKARQSKLVPPLGQWSMACAAMSAEATHFCLGLQSGQVLEEQAAGLLAGTTSVELLLRVGRLGGAFPGVLGLVCLYAAKLDAALLHAACSGATSPLDIPGLAFAWQPSSSGDLDLVSMRVPVVSGTRVWPEAPQPLAELLKPKPMRQPELLVEVAAMPAPKPEPATRKPDPQRQAPVVTVVEPEPLPGPRRVPILDFDVELLTADLRKKKVDNRPPFGGIFDAEFTVSPAAEPEPSGLLAGLGRKLGLGPKKK